MKDFRVPRVRYSDHLPLVCDFTPEGRERGGAGLMTAGVFLYTFTNSSSIVIRIVMLCYIPQRHSPTTAMLPVFAVYFWPWPGSPISPSVPPPCRGEGSSGTRPCSAPSRPTGPPSRILDDESRPWLPEELVRFRGRWGKNWGHVHHNGQLLRAHRQGREFPGARS